MTKNADSLRRWAPAAIAVALMIVAAAGNLAATLDHRARSGLAFDLAVPILDEVSSTLAWLALTPAIVLAFRSLVPPRFSWAVILPAHAAVATGVSLVHYSLTRLLRAIVHSVWGQDFRIPVSWEGYLLDLYGDGLTYLLLGLIYCGAQTLLAARAKTADAGGAAPSVLEVRDGAQTLYLPTGEILWVEAAGNYVELHASGGRAILMRATLAGLAQRLEASGFLRVHRSRLVNIASVVAIDSHASGDATLRLDGGGAIAASRRYRPALAKVLAERARI